MPTYAALAVARTRAGDAAEAYIVATTSLTTVVGYKKHTSFAVANTGLQPSAKYRDATGNVVYPL